MKRTNVEIARMVESKGYNFTEALESIDAGRTPEDEKKEITQEEIDEMVEAICLSFEIDVEGQTKMKEERLYELAYEALSNKWAREYDFLKEHPENEISQIREKELWNELIELDEEMKLKGWR